MIDFQKRADRVGIVSLASGRASMSYIGIDYLLGLGCSACSHVISIRYSLFLQLSSNAQPIICPCCGRTTNHGSRNAQQVRSLVAERMRAEHSSQDA